MKKYLMRTASTLLICIGALTTLCSCCVARRQIITGDWSEPTVRFSTVQHSSSPDNSTLLVFYYYQLKQSAQLKYPPYVWKNTDWERKITERLNIIDAGYGVASIDDSNVTVLPVEEPVSAVFWSNDAAFCKTKRGWFRIVGNKQDILPFTFVPPEGVTNSLSQPEPMLPTTADKHPEISRHILDASLGAKSKRNYYKPKKKD